MAEQRGGSDRRLRAVPAGEPAPETAASLLPGAPRVGALDALLRDLDGLRLSLETDLDAVADAVAAGAPRQAGELIDGDRAALAAFEQRALGHLAELAAAPAAPRRRRRRGLLPAAPFVAAAALIGFVSGVVPSRLGGEPSSPTLNVSNAAASSYVRLTELANGGASAGQVRAAALDLHADLAPLIARASTDPVAAEQALAMLSDEQLVLTRSGSRADLLDVLQQSQALTRRLVAILPSGARRTTPTAPRRVVLPAATASPTRTTSKPAASSSPAPRPSASATPAPSGSPTPQPAPTPSGPGLPTNPSLR